MRIDKYLSHSGYGSRKDVKKLIKDKLVKVNNIIITSDSININENSDIILVDDEQVTFKEFYYLLINKPEGYISSTEDEKYPAVTNLIGEYQQFNLAPVGRLDVDTTGLCLLTNNGKLNHFLLSPRSHVDKEYEVEVNYPLEDKLIDKFKKGVVIDEDYRCLPAELIIKDEYHCNVIIHEGKFHQIKKMFASFGYTVMKLNRIRMSFLTLGNLKISEYRELTDEEINRLLKENMR